MTRWWVRLVVRRTLGCVGSADVEGASFTFGSVVCWSSFKMAVNCFSILTCLRRSITDSGCSFFNISTRSAAASTMRSPSEMVCVQQCAG